MEIFLFNHTLMSIVMALTIVVLVSWYFFYPFWTFILNYISIYVSLSMKVKIHILAKNIRSIFHRYHYITSITHRFRDFTSCRSSVPLGFPHCRWIIGKTSSRIWGCKPLNLGWDSDNSRQEEELKKTPITLKVG